MGLKDLGVPSNVEEGYAILQRQGPVDRESLRLWLAKSEDIDDVLLGLRNFGLARVSEDGHWSAEDPDAVAVAFQERASRLADELRATAAEASSSDEAGSIELLHGIARINEFLRDRVSRAHLVQGFDLPPYVNIRDDESKLDAEGLSEIAPEWGVLERGGRLQSIYDPKGFAGNPTKVKEMSSFVAAGEEARVAEVHTKLIIFDRQEALVGLLSTYERGIPEQVLSMRTDHRILIDALCSMFDTTWSAAFPWMTPDPATKTDRDLRRERLIKYLLAGFDRQAIAADLGVSARTVARDIDKLRADFGVDGQDAFLAGLQIGMKLEQSRSQIW